MSNVNLVLSIPLGAVTATSLGIDGFARHRSPGSGKYFRGRKLYVDLAVKDGRPDFEYLDEGGWRDAAGDTASALAAAAAGKRTKTALSNNAFSVTPIDAYRSIHLVKTGGETLRMEQGRMLHRFGPGVCREEMSPSEVAEASGSPQHVHRPPRMYLVMCPIELVIMSNLTPVEYAWYATHRPGKVFRQVIFTEVQPDQPHLAAQSRFTDATRELGEQPDKKTKTIVSSDCMNEVLFSSWVGYGQQGEGGIYVADRGHVQIWPFPAEIPHDWDSAIG